MMEEFLEGQVSVESLTGKEQNMSVSFQLSAFLFYLCLSLSVFFLVVSCSIALLSACKCLSALHSGLCRRLELSHL